MEGEVLLRHPLRYRLLAWASVVLVACFALTLHYTRLDQHFTVSGHTERSVPGADTTTVLIKVPADKVGWIRPQQRLTLVLSPGAHTSTNNSAISVPATIDRISAHVELPAATAEKNAGPFVSVHVRIHRDDALIAGRPLVLEDGVGVSADIPAGRVSVLQYLMGEQARPPYPQHATEQTQ